ncbi:biotin-dependent carboxyltransferase family protein [Bacillus sp. 2205SS5-2]|uniref:5-oxoprolinase subunit C family protein n=1 Tax=Bacillus sp. 2205SS5-2 TaxID=3109031 RepID=UPI0030053851
MSLTINKSGFMTTVQDLGRVGYRKYGVPRSGAMDTWALELANITLGNPKDSACLEITLIGPTIEFNQNTLICICGGKFSATLNQQSLWNGKIYPVSKGDILKMDRAFTGCRAYIAVKGGIQIQQVLKSSSTYMTSGFGGLHGRSLQPGDTLFFQPCSEKRSKWRLSSSLFHYLGTAELRLIRGNHFDDFSTSSQIQLFTSQFQVTSDSNRMGYRLNGDSLHLKQENHYSTEGITIGSIQVPPSGEPIVLMSDAQTTGGYPKIAHIVSADLRILAQKKPHDLLTFIEVDWEEAFKINQELQLEQKLVTSSIHRKKEIFK